MTENHDPPDPRIERLVALLYGELSEQEEREMRALLETDPALRRDWEELVATRTVLTGWDLEEETPRFVFVGERGGGAHASAGARRWFLGIPRLWSPRLAWITAAAAVLIAVLASADLRIESGDGRLYVGFGERTPAGSDRLAEKVPGDLPMPPRGGEARTGALEEVPGALHPQPAAQAGPYLTYSEFDAYTEGMARTLAALLNEYARQRDHEVTGLLESAFRGLASKQEEDYQRVQAEIALIRDGLTQEQFDTRLQIQYLLRQAQQGSWTPAEVPAGSEEGEER